MRRFWITVHAVTAVMHVPFACGLAYALELSGVPGPAWVAAAVAAVLVFGFRGRVRRAMHDRHRPAWVTLLLDEPYFVHWCAALLMLPLSAVALLAIAVLPARVAPGAALCGAYLAGAAVAAWGVFVRRRWVRVRTVDVAIAGLGPDLDGYRIAHLSDLHIGSYCPRARAERWARIVNGLDVDLVALTGDYVTSGTAFHGDIAAVLSSFRAKDGTVAVMGNHDYFGDGEPLVSLLRGGGVRVLRNERLELERGRSSLTIAGVDDTWTRRANVSRALAGRDPKLPAVVLAHDPALFPDLARRNASLVLCGHTHWGQVAVPFLATRWNLSALGQRHHAGLYREGSSALYVHPGLGTTGPPVRLGAPPEIAVLRLRRAVPEVAGARATSRCRTAARTAAHGAAEGDAEVLPVAAEAGAPGAG